MIKKNKEFVYLYRRGKTVASKILLLAYAPQRSKRILFGFSVSKKIGNSVVRNRIKRRLRECARKNMELFNSSYRYVFTARGPIADATYEQINQTMLYLVRKASLNHEKKT